jgi:hypothetical protein
MREVIVSEPTCADCKFHGPEGKIPSHGDCRALPPDNAQHIGSGLVMTYRQTSDALPACALFQPKAPAIVPLETKGEAALPGYKPSHQNRPRR